MKTISATAITILLTSAIWSCKTPKETEKYDTISIRSISTAKWLQRSNFYIRDTIRIRLDTTKDIRRKDEREIEIIRHLKANTETSTKDTIVKKEITTETNRETKRSSVANPISTNHNVIIIIVITFVIVLGYVLIKNRRR